MKKILLHIILIFLSLCLKAQTYPLIQNIASGSTKLTIPNYGALYGGMIPLSFSDTSAANTALTYGKNYAGFLIFTTTERSLWYRDITGNRWVMVLPSGSPVYASAWVYNGNNLASYPDSAVLGTTSNTDWFLIANNLKFLKINKGGIQPNSGSVVNLGVNMSTGDLSFGSSSSTPTWQQTLTAGSTLNQDNTVDGGAHDFVWNNNNVFQLYTNASTNQGFLAMSSGSTASVSIGANSLSGPNTSNINFNKDLISIQPYLGALTIDTLNNETFQNTLLGWTTTSGANRGKLGYITLGTGLSLSSGVLSAAAAGLTVGTSTIASGTIGGVIFQGAGNVVQQDATNLFWDDINNRLGVGTNVPANTFDALSSGTAGRFKSSGYSSSTLIIEDPDGTTYITNGQFKVNTVPFVLNANASYLSLQTAGVERINVANAGDITLKGATIYAIPVTTGVDLSGGQYNAADAGLYHITVGDVSNAFNLPDAAAMTGKTVKIIMKVGDSSPITSSGGSVFDKLGSALSTITGGTYTFTSDGTDWWEF